MESTTSDSKLKRLRYRLKFAEEQTRRYQRLSADYSAMARESRVKELTLQAAITGECVRADIARQQKYSPSLRI